MSTVSGRVQLTISADEILAAIGGGKGVFKHEIQELLDLATGTSDGQINKAWSKVETGIGSAVTTVYDLIGSLTDKDGTVINFDEVVLVAVKNLASTATQWLTVGPDATAGFGVAASNKGFWVAAIGAGGGDVIVADGQSWMVKHCRSGVPAAAGSTDELSVVTQAVTGNTWFILILGRDNP